ncbi:hypothetical protein ABKW28_11065 [Nocardioides sp. 31GB23]|uniref:lipopolysaccharide biosynthesis protein n=1 Tax=Nocardioides sp. 31GB23 TaxID=3156065 RepID=UPI0032AED501
MQALGFCAGLVVIRNLTQADYAAYSLAVSLLAAMTLLADSGVSSAALRIAGENVESPAHLRETEVSALETRKTLVRVCAAVFLPLVFALQLRLGQDIWSAIAIAAVVQVAFVSTLRANLVAALLRVQYEFAAIQRTNSVLSVLRLVWVLPLFLWPLGMVWALFANLLSAWAQQRRMQTAFERRTPQVRLSPSRVSETQVRLKEAVRRTLPVNLGITLQSQAIYPLLATLGAVTALAEISAIARFAVVSQLGTSIVLGVLDSVIARSSSKTARLRVARIVGFAAILLMGVAAALVIARDPLLRLLGEEYSDLDIPFAIIMVGSALNATTAIFGGLNAARMWIGYGKVYLVALTLWATTAILFVPIGTTVGAACVVASSFLPRLCLEIIRFSRGDGVGSM